MSVAATDDSCRNIIHCEQLTVVLTMARTSVSCSNWQADHVNFELGSHRFLSRAGAQDSGAGDLAVEMRKQQRKDAALIAVRLVATDMPWEIYYKVRCGL